MTRTYIIGRSAHADIVLADASVDPHHAELVKTDDGRYFLTDCGRPGGTWTTGGPTTADPAWQPIRQTYLDIDQALRLGDFQCRLRDLLALLPDPGPAGDEHPARLPRPHGSVQRDPHTGEVVRRRL